MNDHLAGSLSVLDETLSRVRSNSGSHFLIYKLPLCTCSCTEDAAGHKQQSWQIKANFSLFSRPHFTLLLIYAADNQHQHWPLLCHFNPQRNKQTFSECWLQRYSETSLLVAFMGAGLGPFGSYFCANSSAIYGEV